MEKLITYSSQYGTAKEYALELAKRTGFKVKDIKEVKKLTGVDELIHVGSLYAGGLKGLNTVLKLIDNKIKLTIVTVGLADPDDESAKQRIDRSIEAQLPKDRKENTKIFSLRGGIDYSRLSFMHRTMMKLFYSQLKKNKEQTAETQAIFDTYGKTVSFVDFDTLEPVIEYVK